MLMTTYLLNKVLIFFQVLSEKIGPNTLRFARFVIFLILVDYLFKVVGIFRVYYQNCPGNLYMRTHRYHKLLSLLMNL